MAEGHGEPDIPSAKKAKRTSHFSPLNG